MNAEAVSADTIESIAGLGVRFELGDPDGVVGAGTGGITIQGDGSFSFTLTGLRPAINASAWAYTIDHTRYAACITIQYGYKPSANCAWLIVEPQATSFCLSFCAIFTQQ